MLWLRHRIRELTQFPFPLYNARATAIYNPEAVMNKLSMSSDDKPNAVPSVVTKGLSR